MLLITNYNVLKLNEEVFTKLSKSWHLKERLKIFTDGLNLTKDSKLFQSLTVL